MADRRVDVLIVGAGPAGSAAAEALRDGGFDGSILLAGREPDAPYDRTPASKSYLRGESSRASHALYDDGFWAQRKIDLRTRTSVMRLDAGERVATLASKETVGFDRALLATGANVRRLRVDGATLEGIHYLRALGNSDAIRAEAQDAERVVLIGGSYIACEVAASLAALGKACTLVAMEGQPLANGFGATVGAWVGERLREHGVQLALAETLADFEPSASGSGERVGAVVCESGRRVECDMVVMGTGAQPDVLLARGAGLDLGGTGGIACDRRLRTSAEGIWAAGDACEYDSVVHRRRLRVEHWEVARAQGAFAARSMLGDESPYSEVPYFWSDLGDWLTLESVGPASGWDAEVVRGSLPDGAFTVFYLSGGVLAQAVTVGRADDLDLARRLMTSGEDLRGREAVLADPDGEIRGGRRGRHALTSRGGPARGCDR